MKIEILRNATLILHYGDHSILVDPMLAKKGALPAFSFFRHKAERNPTVALPEGAKQSLSKVTHALITHCQRGHMDHLDKAGEKFLRDRSLLTYCRAEDQIYLEKRGISTVPLKTAKRQAFPDGFITPIPARHGHGWISALMGRGVGYFIEPTGQPSVYISGDTVLTDDVRSALTDLKPDIAVVAAGNASMDVGKPILMSVDEVVEFAQLAPGKVVANHLEALNHCPITREQLAIVSSQHGLTDKMAIPADGETLNFTGFRS